ncbi:MAG TPA: hypothetical protein VLR69_00800 [Thermoanaerobaculia bacterium]|nr:hypothetical protein [Thermoanaerobaculia bacterium]
MSRLLFVLALAIATLGGLFTPKAEATCTQHCTLVSCGYECCTYSDCTTHCFNVFCGN